jgi:hypothetical protein
MRTRRSAAAAPRSRCSFCWRCCRSRVSAASAGKQRVHPEDALQRGQARVH